MIRRSLLQHCFFAAKPAPTPQAILDLAHSRSGDGLCVYGSRAAVVEVLDAVAATGPVWWTDACSKFADDVRDSPCGSALANASPDVALPPVVLVEGLDGVGKTTVTTALAEKLGGVLIRTPDPALDQVRGRFRVAEEVIARAFYCGANYLAADAIAKAVLEEGKPVVIDRWWTSTAAFAIAQNPQLPTAEAAAKVGAWPNDLPKYDLGVILTVDEEVRLKRMAKRGDENPEEAKLAQDRALRERAMAAYAALGPRPLEPTMVLTYMIATNVIIDRLVKLEAASPAADPAVASAAGRRVALPAGFAKAKFTQEEQRGCAPW
mmetsp:Transcript_37514/g.115859  ORF Transcript_37514/g.115859 Transcript_37514/m.115859 type:complete len:321 (-) Transcript_37514:125-1087(-)